MDDTRNFYADALHVHEIEANRVARAIEYFRFGHCGELEAILDCASLELIVRRFAIHAQEQAASAFGLALGRREDDHLVQAISHAPGHQEAAEPQALGFMVAALDLPTPRQDRGHRARAARCANAQLGVARSNAIG